MTEIIVQLWYDTSKDKKKWIPLYSQDYPSQSYSVSKYLCPFKNGCKYSTSGN